MTEAITLWTIGHGSRSIEEFLVLLRAAEIRHLVDVRAYPTSRRYPHFSRAALAGSLADACVRYAWEGKALGGRRAPTAASAHVTLMNLQFRAYADHMTTPVFREGLERLIRSAREERTAFMCAERPPAECHRSFISDALCVRGIAVRHLVTAGEAEPHVLSALARRTETGIVYDVGAQLTLDALQREP